MGYQDTIRVLYGYAPERRAVVGFACSRRARPPVWATRSTSTPSSWPTSRRSTWPGRRSPVARASYRAGQEGEKTRSGRSTPSPAPRSPRARWPTSCARARFWMRGSSPGRGLPGGRRAVSTLVQIGKSGEPTPRTTSSKALARQPVLVQVLGTCPTLGSPIPRATRSRWPGDPGRAGRSNALIASIRRSCQAGAHRQLHPGHRSLVTIVDYGIQAISLEVHKALGAFIALIVVNCIILGRAEAFARRTR